MRPGGVPILLLLIGTLVTQAMCAEDLYWEGEEDANDFLQVKEDDTGIGQHFRRIRSPNFFDFWGTPSSTEATLENVETATDDPVDDTIPDGKDDESDSDGSGLPDKTEPEPREKTLRVTFVVMEPYQNSYSNRDSIEFQDFSHSIADAVNELFETLPGTQRASLVRIQSRLSDEFSCKVTLDIVTTGYEDTDRITNNLRDHIHTRRKLGSVTVNDADFSANVIDPGSTLNACDAHEIQCSDGQCVPQSSRCNGYTDCNDGSDEAGCPLADYWSGFKQEHILNLEPSTKKDLADCAETIACSASSINICPHQWCNDVIDCPFGDDELECSPGPEVRKYIELDRPSHENSSYIQEQSGHHDVNVDYITNGTLAAESETEVNSSWETHKNGTSDIVDTRKCQANETVTQSIEKMMQIISADLEGDTYFVLSLVPLLKSLKFDQKLELKIKILEIFRTISKDPK